MKTIVIIAVLTSFTLPARAINLNEIVKQKIQEAGKKAVPAPAPAAAPAPAPAPYKQNCANLLSDGGFLFAAWASAPLAPESEIKKLWDTQIKQLCLQSECPLFCSEEQGKVPAELLLLQKQCRDKNVAACDSFFKAIKVDDQGSSSHFCFYVGGKACDFCDRLGGEYCKPGMRFGGPKQNIESGIIYKIACSSGFTEACDFLNQKSQEAIAANQKKCSETSDEDACRTRLSYLIDLGKIKEALDQAMKLCQKSEYKSCTSFIPRMHKDFPSANGENFKKAFEEALKPDCFKKKKVEACFILAEATRNSQPDAALKLFRRICQQSGPNLRKEIARESCEYPFYEAIGKKQWTEADKFLKALCRKTKLCSSYENYLKRERSKK